MGGAGWKRSVRGGIAAALAAVVALGASSAAGADGGGGRDLKVMTQNLYLGSSFDPVLTPQPPPPDVPPALAPLYPVRKIYETVVATNFRVRAAAIADRIAAERPDLIGLQEVADWKVNGSNDDPRSYDFLAILQQELDNRGVHYRAESTSENVTVGPLPLWAPNQGCGVPIQCTVSFHDRDVILVNLDAGISVSNRDSQPFKAQQVLAVPNLGDLSFDRGWALIDGAFQGHHFRFVTTHLEVDTFPTVQQDQARELVAGPLATLRPVILVGDLNSAADGSTTASYRIVLKALFADAWWTNFGRLKGFTCCQAERLDNPTSQLTSRIDYVLVRLALPTSAHLVNENPIAQPPDLPPYWASDHAGVIATIHLF